MTTTATKPLLSARIGMTPEQAGEYMRRCWQRFKDHKGNTVKYDKDGGCTFEQFMSVYDAKDLGADLRDCGWCLGHSGGFWTMAKAHDIATKGLNWNKEGHDFSRAIDYAFSGIADWMS